MSPKDNTTHDNQLSYGKRGPDVYKRLLLHMIFVHIMKMNIDK